MIEVKNRSYNDPDLLRQLYWDAGCTQKQIADLFGTTPSVISKAMAKNGVPTRHNNLIVSLGTRHDGYESWELSNGTVYHHQLVAISDGANPYKVFGQDYVVHHKNKIRWDNRAENLEVMTKSEHGKHHHEQGDFQNVGKDKQYTKEEIISWIDAFVEEFGFVPSSTDLYGWPGPTPVTMGRYFGSYTAAVEAAGYEPRGHESNRQDNRGEADD